MDLAENGTKAVGTIVNVQDTGVTINDVNVRVALRLGIEPLDGSAPFEADKKRASIVAMFGDAFAPDGSGVGQVAVAAPAAAAPADPIERLTKLQALREAGALSDEEFAEQKAKILADA